MDTSSEKFSIVKKGYNPEEVDRYIETLESVIKSYKEKDNAIKNAIVSAQMAADNIVKNAHVQAEEIKNRSVKQIDYIFNSVKTQRSMVNDFQNDFNIMVKRYFTDFNESEINKVYSKINDLEEYLQKLQSSDVEQDSNSDDSNVPQNDETDNMQDTRALWDELKQSN